MLTSVVVLGVAFALIPSSASAIELIDPEAFHVNPDELPHVTIGDAESSVLSDLHINGSELTGLDKSLVELSPEEDRDDLDWCLWSAAFQMAAEMAEAEPPANVGAGLEGHLISCLKSHFEGTDEASSIGWVAKALTIKNQLELLEAMGDSPGEAWIQLIQSGISLPAETWKVWFERFAAAVPPV